jgi:hypothetical protein
LAWAESANTPAALSNANMEYGYKQGVAVLPADTACHQGRRIVFSQADGPVV